MEYLIIILSAAIMLLKLEVRDLKKLTRELSKDIALLKKYKK